jgi:hypothetical protein
MPPDAESLERGTHRSDWTIAAHGCNSIVDDVIRNAVTNPATGPGGRPETVAFEIRVPLRDDNPPRSGVNHVVVQAHNEVAHRGVRERNGYRELDGTQLSGTLTRRTTSSTIVKPRFR